MEHLDFVLWTILYPVASALVNYIGIKKIILENRKLPSEDAQFIGALVNLMIWILVGKALF
jgi:hypothetical protein